MKASTQLIMFSIFLITGIANAQSIREGRGTHYGPWPSFPYMSEPGYQPLNVGVGCSTGVPGGDPQFNEILAQGTYPAPAGNPTTIWPKAHCVAVSEAVWGGARKQSTCWETLKITNKATGITITAYIVDFCPTNGCLWKKDELYNNVDIYGEETWKALGADPKNDAIGVLDLEIEWPSSMVPPLTDTQATSVSVPVPKKLKAAPTSAPKLATLPGIPSTPAPKSNQTTAEHAVDAFSGYKNEEPKAKVPAKKCMKRSRKLMKRSRKTGKRV